MKKVLPIASAALVLSVCTAFAEPPLTAIPDYHSGAGNRGLEQLTDTDMVALTGGAWWSGACTAAVYTGGAIVWLSGVLSGNQVHQAAGLAAPYVAAAACH